MGVLAQEERVPRWLRAFLVGDYFSHCHTHSYRKNERNHFCINCIEGPLCHMGLEEHIGHRTLQVRRASHMDAVRVHDAQKLADISSIQTYSINGAKIVFLLCRPQHKIVKDAPHCCISCGRSLPDPVNFCCISCKLSAVSNRKDATATLCLHDSSFGSHTNLAAHEAIPVMPPPAAYYCSPHERRFVNALAVYLKKCSKEHRDMEQLRKPPKKRIRPEDTTDAKECRALEYATSFDPALAIFVSNHPMPSSSEKIQPSQFTSQSSQTAGRFLSSIPQVKHWQGSRLRRRKGYPRRSPFV